MCGSHLQSQVKSCCQSTTSSTDNNFSLTLKMTSAQVVETSATNNSSFQNYSHQDDHTIRTAAINIRLFKSQNWKASKISKFKAIHPLTKSNTTYHYLYKEGIENVHLHEGNAWRKMSAVRRTVLRPTNSKILGVFFDISLCSRLKLIPRSYEKYWYVRFKQKALQHFRHFL